MKTLVKFFKIIIQVISTDKAEIFLISITKKITNVLHLPTRKTSGQKMEEKSVRSHFLKLLLKFSLFGKV